MKEHIFLLPHKISQEYHIIINYYLKFKLKKDQDIKFKIKKIIK